MTLMKSIKKTLKLKIGFFGVFVLILVGCSNSSDEFIQGKFARGDVHFWEEWNFSQGTYMHIYDDTHVHRQETGRYAVLDFGENFILLELIDQQGGIPSIEDRVELMITFDLQADTIHLRRGDFTRVSTSTLKELSTRQVP